MPRSAGVAPQPMPEPGGGRRPAAAMPSVPAVAVPVAPPAPVAAPPQQRKGDGERGSNNRRAVER
jgi:hypothetical protein